MMSVHVAIIGLGLIGSLYTRICQQMTDVRVVAVHDVQPDRAQQAAALTGAQPYSTPDYAPMLVSHPEINAVLVCTPVEFHLEPALAVIAAGKHLLLEKPLAATLADARRIEQAAAQADITAMVSYSLRFDPRYVAMKQAVDAGRIGEVIHLYGQRNPSLDAYIRIGGRTTLPFWVTVHDIDMLRWITGSEITRVYASASRIGFEDQPHERAILTNLTFASGAVAILENAWRATTASHPQLSISAFHVHGTRGSVEIRGADSGVTIIADGVASSPDTVNMPEIGGEVTGIYRNEIAAFVRGIRDGAPSLIPLCEGVKGVAVAEAIRQSLQTGQPVMVEQG